MDKHLIDKFFDGRATEEEARQVLGWYLSGKLDEKVAAAFELYWNESYGKKDWNAERKFAELEQRMQLTESPAVVPLRTWRRRLPVMAKAAAVLLLVAAGLLVFLLPPRKQAQHMEMAVFRTGPGERKTVTLPDASEVHLQASSSITFEKDFTAGARHVKLEGEAYFDVKGEAGRPFVVQAGKVVTEVLGTAFNVRYDPGRHSPDSVKVCLVSGKVSVSVPSATQPGKRSSVILRPGQYASTSAGSTLLAGEFNAREVQWIEGLLYFDSITFQEVLVKMEAWYGVNITLENGAGNRLYSGEFKNETLQNVLESMAFSGGFHYTISGKNVRIAFGK